MSSIKKPPLPTYSIIASRPGLFCLDWKGTQRMCDEENRKRKEENERSLKEFEEKLLAWRNSNK